MYEGLHLHGGPVINKGRVVPALRGSCPGEKTRGEPGTGSNHDLDHHELHLIISMLESIEVCHHHAQR